MDRDWWKVYNDEVIKSFFGVKYSNNKMPPMYNVTHLPEFKSYGNSGASCISMAAQGGASRIILLGFDCQHTDGKSHWHGDHPAHLANAGLIDRWMEKYAEMKSEISGIINASRETAITCFTRAKLEDLI